MSLAQKKCEPCEGGTPPMALEQAKKLLQQISQWQLLQINGTYTIEKGFKFKNFAEAISFVKKVAAVAEEQGHHPDIKISWNKVTLQLTTHATHAIKGLSENDFIMAAKIDRLV
ncbi:4a-hydroxytetrahydrobiopterin dehydratase [Candidatus Woesearchaeota archaeon]|nr:4a-hydroxytetrahydrobiopterin dehydratase [Candidatus Woesearchaeota archaeon]